MRGEAAWAGELGVTGNVAGRLWLDGGIFHSEYDDLIDAAPVPGQFLTFQFRNVAEARIRGLDLGAKLGLLERWLALDLTYTYLDTEDLRTGEPLPYRSTHNLTGTLSSGPIGLDVRHRSRVERVLAFPLDPRDAFTVVDLRLGYRVLGVGLQAKVSNLFQEEYVDVQERNLGEPRRFLLTAVRSF